MSTTRTQLHVEVPEGEPVIRFSRFVAASPETVWRCWTEPELIKRWLGPRYLTTTVCESDLSVGGQWRFVHTAPDGTEHAFHGEYLEIDPPRRLARTFVYDPMPEAWTEEWIELEAVDGGTLLRGQSTHASIETRDAHIANGMEHGMNESMERLDEVLLAGI
jgi:uncharacterized protein YndB with AHSA1/START domain